MAPERVAARAIEGLSGSIEVLSARWTADEIARLAERLSAGALRLAAIPRERRLAVWNQTVEVFLDANSPERQELTRDLTILSRLSNEGLAAALETVLGGVSSGPMARLFAEADSFAPAEAGCAPGVGAAFLAGNLPALVVQPLAAAVALGRPMLFKSSSSEPLFASAFLAALARREPRFGEAYAAVTWRGGDLDLEAPLLARAEVVIAYGEAKTLADLAARAGGRIVGYGPKVSLAVVGRAADLSHVARSVARDVALFDQRGCLSIHAVYVEGGPSDAVVFASALGEALKSLARELPPGPASLAEKSAVRQLRETQELAGGFLWGGPLAHGTVLVAADSAFHPSPGLRTVRIHPLADLRTLPAVLSPWSGRLQGVALDGVDDDLARALQSAPSGSQATQVSLGALGVSRIVPAGRLQQPDVTWHNGGVPPLRALAADCRPL